jgi:hypothetical protein
MEFRFQSARGREPKTHGRGYKSKEQHVSAFDPKRFNGHRHYACKIGDNIGQRTITTIVVIIINQRGNDCGGGHVGV